MRDAAFGNVQIAEHFDARDNGGVPLFGDGLHSVLQDTVNAVLHGNFAVARFNVNVTGAALERGEDDRFDQAHDGTDGGVAGEAVTGNSFVGVFVFLGNLQGKRFGGLLEHALGLLGALQEVADLARRGDLDGKFFAQAASGSSSLRST